MTQFEFDKLIEKYMAGECDTAEERLIEEWSDRQISTSSLHLSAQEEKITNKRLKRRIDASTVGVIRFPFRFSLYRLGIAACFLGIIGFGLWFWSKESVNTESIALTTKKAEFKLSNTTNAEQEFKLKDGSTITLQPQSQLTYLEDFGVKKRIVFLKGEGYFQIKRDTAKPFYVHAGNLVTKVLGTKFIIKAYENKKTEVVVTSGKVMVYENNKGKVAQKVFLTPNQKVDYEPDQTALTPVIVDEPIVVNAIKNEGDFDFNQTDLLTVLKRLKDVYAIDILLKNKSMGQCLFTGNLNGLTLSEQLDLICKSIDATFQKYETAIWIEGEGCS